MAPEYQKFFPKPSFYPNQKEAMDSIYDALLAKKLVLFEGACGTGKTLSALAPSLAIARKEKKKVIIATNVHQQMEQFIDEAREIRGMADIKVAVLKGKAHMCPLEKDYDECNVLRENTYELLEIERDLSDLRLKEKDAIQKAKQGDRSFADLRNDIVSQIRSEEDRLSGLRKRSCGYLREVLLKPNEQFNDWLFKGVRRPEEIVEESLKKGQCGYELLKRNLKEAELIICNYHHLLDPGIQRTVLSWMDCELDDVIIIFDEAHNLEPQARSHSSQTLSEHTVDKAIFEAASIKSDIKDEIEFFQLLLKNTIVTAYESRFGFGDVERLTASWMDITIRDPYGRDDLLCQKIMHELSERKIDVKKLLEEAVDRGIEIDEKYREEYKNGRSESKKTSALLMVSAFMLSYINQSHDVNHYPVLNVRRTREGEVYGRIELFSCIPTEVTKPLMNGAFGVVLMSATLKPFDMVRKTLGIERETLEISFGTTFPPERRRTIAVDIAPQFAKNRGEQGMVENMVSLLEDVINYSDGNVLIFFPSSGEALKYYNLIKVDVPVFLDEAGISAQDTKNEFFKQGDSGGKAVLISYLWGTLTEGVDYKFDRCRTVVVVGVGFPSLNDRMKAIQNAYDDMFGIGKGWEYGVLYPTIRRIRQANGRVVRSPLDYGLRILADARYTAESVKTLKRFSVHMHFPEDERKEFRDVKPDKVKYSMMNFFNDLKAPQEEPSEPPVKQKNPGKKKKSKA
ncbi:ATP-dependent DNA helicase [Methanocella sp. CWC-04]|uniref:ATP-dependent DNA helicase n=1 Tax=Methanooceanicella nereidis TaxID=2052831 RepID=A0AAP2RAF6_9EURY|nr:ATP-dependent DNA helicase [Methanocella sp. CWC-04]MCD1293708.1 ATP-dependent DNA helicase [Methanocella sp. CWC-04]